MFLSGPIGMFLSGPIRSYHVFMSVVVIGLIVEMFLAVKIFYMINTIAATIVTIVSDRMIS